PEVDVLVDLLRNARVDGVRDVLDEELIVGAVSGGYERLAVSRHVPRGGDPGRPVRGIDDRVRQVARRGLMVHAHAEVQAQTADFELLEGIDTPDLSARGRGLRIGELVPLIADLEARASVRVRAGGCDLAVDSLAARRAERRVVLGDVVDVVRRILE